MFNLSPESSAFKDMWEMMFNIRNNFFKDNT